MALELGVPQDALMIDRNGIHTLQTCMNARAFMDDGNSVALITHEYHLPRAMMVCDLLGIDSIGVIAEQGYYPPQVLFIWRVRECFASLYAFLRLIL
jgi:SanA protein